MFEGLQRTKVPIEIRKQSNRLDCCLAQLPLLVSEAEFHPLRIRNNAQRLEDFRTQQVQGGAIPHRGFIISTNERANQAERLINGAIPDRYNSLCNQGRVLWAARDDVPAIREYVKLQWEHMEPSGGLERKERGVPILHRSDEMHQAHFNLL